MSTEEQEKKIKHFQLALSMVGITANLMTAELIRSLSEGIDAKGTAFTVQDAIDISERIQHKYNMQEQMHRPIPPKNLPPDLQKMVDSGQVVMGKKPEQKETPQ